MLQICLTPSSIVTHPDILCQEYDVCPQAANKQNRLIRVPMPSCIPGSSRNWPPFSRRVHPPQQRFQKSDGGRTGTRFPQPSSWIACTRPYVCGLFWITWQDITVAIWSSGVGNEALDF